MTFLFTHVYKVPYSHLIYLYDSRFPLLNNVTEIKFPTAKVSREIIRVHIEWNGIDNILSRDIFFDRWHSSLGSLDRDFHGMIQGKIKRRKWELPGSWTQLHFIKTRQLCELIEVWGQFLPNIIVIQIFDPLHYDSFEDQSSRIESVSLTMSHSFMALSTHPVFLLWLI